ncbi:MAG TPA: hypothetical protein VM843_06545 [Flavisolibacter sp.]|nr:hypothetical protein [Flavisolibacter sp.]
MKESPRVEFIGCLTGIVGLVCVMNLYGFLGSLASGDEELYRVSATTYVFLIPLFIFFQ